MIYYNSPCKIAKGAPISNKYFKNRREVIIFFGRSSARRNLKFKIHNWNETTVETPQDFFAKDDFI